MNSATCMLSSSKLISPQPLSTARVVAKSATPASTTIGSQIPSTLLRLQPITSPFKFLATAAIKVKPFSTEIEASKLTRISNPSGGFQICTSFISIQTHTQIKTMQNSSNISAVIFDLDGTLLNTEQLTKNVLKDFLAKYGKVQDSEKEKKRMGLTFKESTEAILADYDLPLTFEQFSIEIMPMYKGKWLQAKALPGANRLMEHLHKHGVPFSLASNSLTNTVIGKVLNQDGWKERFKAILGSDQVRSGKPSPDLFLEAANRMDVDPLQCLVIEDSLVGVKAGKAAGMQVVAVPSMPTEADSFSIADTILHSLLDFQPELWGLPPFQDLVDKALHIEPIHLTGVFTNGILQMHADNEISILPDQLWGLYIGWAKFDGQKIFKAVISIGWAIGCCRSKREIRACIIDGIERDDSNDAKLQLLLMGYLHTSFRPGNILNCAVISKEDKRTAEAFLSSPQFSHKSCIFF